MNKLVAFWALLLVLPFTSSCFGQAADSSEIVSSVSRCWRAFSHEFSNIYGLEEDEIKVYSKKRVCFGNDSISTFYGAAYDPKYSVKRVNAEKYSQENFDCSKTKLNINADSVYEVTVHSQGKPTKKGTIPKMTDVLLYDGTCVYMMADGVIFRMVDADAVVRPTSSN